MYQLTDISAAADFGDWVFTTGVGAQLDFSSELDAMCIGSQSTTSALPVTSTAVKTVADGGYSFVLVEATIIGRSLEDDDYCRFDVSVDNGVSWETPAVVEVLDPDDEPGSAVYDGAFNARNYAVSAAPGAALLIRLSSGFTDAFDFCYLVDVVVTGQDTTTTTTTIDYTIPYELYNNFFATAADLTDWTYSGSYSGAQAQPSVASGGGMRIRPFGFVEYTLAADLTPFSKVQIIAQVSSKNILTGEACVFAVTFDDYTTTTVVASIYGNDTLSTRANTSTRVVDFEPANEAGWTGGIIKLRLRNTGGFQSDFCFLDAVGVSGDWIISRRGLGEVDEAAAAEDAPAAGGEFNSAAAVVVNGRERASDEGVSDDTDGGMLAWVMSFLAP